MLRQAFLAAAGAGVIAATASAVFDHRAMALDDLSSLSEPAATVSDAARFVAPGAASMIVLPGTASESHAAAAAEVLAQQAMLRRATEEADAAAEIRRKAEDLSRKFVSEHGAATEVPAAATATTASIAPAEIARGGAEPAAQPVAQQPDLTIVTIADPADAARRKADEAEARASSERAARLAAEANASLAIEQAARALARAREEADAATRRAAAAEARALKATRDAQRQMSKAATATVAADHQRANARVLATAGKVEPPRPAGAIAKPVPLPSPTSKSALGAAAVANPPPPVSDKQAKSTFSPPSLPGLLGLVPSFAK